MPDLGKINPRNLAGYLLSCPGCEERYLRRICAPRICSNWVAFLEIGRGRNSCENPSRSRSRFVHSSGTTLQD